MNLTCEAIARRGLLAPGRRAILPRSEQAALAGHVAACADCRRQQLIVTEGVAAGPAAYGALFRFVDGAGELRVAFADFGDGEIPRASPWRFPARYLAVAAAVLIAASIVGWRATRPSANPSRGLAAGPVGLELFELVAGAREPLAGTLSVGATVLVVGSGAPDTRLYGWVGVEGEPAVSLGATVVAPDGAGAFPGAFTVDRRGDHRFFVTDTAEPPRRDGGAWICPPSHCASVARSVR